MDMLSFSYKKEQELRRVQIKHIKTFDGLVKEWKLMVSVYSAPSFTVVKVQHDFELEIRVTGYI